MTTEEVTTQLNIDITQFKKALTDANRYIRMANSEFDKASAGVEGFADSADGLRAKLKQLGTIQEAQKAKVAALRLEYDRVAQEQGESSKAAQEMAIKLNKAEAAVEKTGAEIKDYQAKLKKAEKDTSELDAATGQMSAAFGKAAKAAGTLAKGLAKIGGKAIITSIKGIAAASGALVTAFLASGEASKEHITEMAKLDAAYKSAGHSTKAAAATYSELYSVIGETDQAVEAAQQIALLADSEEQAAKWAEQGAAVVGKFGDALQPEMFFESANETLKLSEATGGYTQMLEGCGINVEDFNTKLQACSTTEEKQAYMLQVTEQALAGAGDAYREANAAVIENNKAQAALQEQLAGVGEAALPVTSTLKLMGAALLSDLMPNIKTFGTSFKDALGGSKTAAQDMGNAVGGMLQTLVQKFVSALPTIITVGTSIVTNLVQGLASAAPAIGGAVTQLVQYFIQAAPQLLAAGASMVQSLVGAISSNLGPLLSAGGQMVENLLSGIVSNLPSMLQGAMNAIGGFVQGIQTYLPVIIQKGGELLGKLGEGIQTALPGLISQGLDILMNFATTLYDAAPKLIDIGFDLISNLVQGLLDALPALLQKAPEIISKFANIINDNIPKLLKKGAELIWQIIKGIVSAIPDLIAAIPSIIMAIVDVWSAFNWVNLGKNAITWLKNGITNMVASVKTAGKNVLDSIVNILKQLPTKLLELGKSAIGKMRDGVVSMVGTIRTAGSNVLQAIVNAVTSLPAKLLNLAKTAISNMASGISSGIGALRSKATEIVNTVVDTVASLPGKMVEVGKNVIRGVIDGIGSMVGALYDSIVDALGGLVDKAKGALGIKSPSRVFRDIVGKMIPAGIAEGIAKNTKTATKAMVKSMRGIVAAANAELSGSTIGGPGINPNGAAGGGRSGGGKTIILNQYNTSPKSLSRKEIYRDTKNALRFATANA